MKRDLTQLASNEYDLLVIGGGITGACIAWDATLRGLRVALVEKRDFGSATSSNSLKTVHGGLRYLQDGNLRVVRKMIRERQALLRIAPHLVHPLPVLMPTYKNKLMRSKFVLGSAIILNDIVSFDRNRGIEPQQALPNGRIFTQAQIKRRLPGLNDTSINGGVMWYDAQVQNTERLLLSFLLSATSAGAEVANYVSVDGFVRHGKRVVGITALDELTGKPLSVRAQMVVNAAGPWVDDVLSTLPEQALSKKFHLSTAMNLITRQILPDFAVGLTSYYDHPLPNGSTEKRERVLFISPWREYSLVGTLHTPYNSCLDDRGLTEQTIADFMTEVNRTYPAAKLKREDVYQVHQGFLPMIPNEVDPDNVRLVREGQIFDHASKDGLDGLLTVVGVKYTTARYLAEKTVDLLFRKLKRPSPPCQTRCTHLVKERKLEQKYQPIASGTAVTEGHIIHAIQNEMALKLSDVVLRRTDLGSAAPPTAPTLQTCAQIMAAECGWDETHTAQEVKEVWMAYHSHVPEDIEISI